MIQILAWLTWLFPLVASLPVLILSQWKPHLRDAYVVIAGAITCGLATLLIPAFLMNPSTVISSTVPWIPFLNLNFGVYVDGVSLIFLMLATVLGFVVILYSLAYMQGDPGLGRYYFLLLFFIGSMAGLLVAENFFQLFMFWELVGLCSFAMVSFWYQKNASVSGALKVFLMTKIGDVALLMGIILLYSVSGSVSFEDVFTSVGIIALPVLSAVSFLMLLGSMAKSVQMPFHTWLYNAMEAPTSVSCLLHGATMVKAGVYLLIRVHPLFYQVPYWLTSITVVGTVTALLGAVLALNTNDIKGVPAYSTISQIGFMFAAIGTASTPLGIGWFAAIYHMLSHAFFQGLGFLAIGSIVHQMGTRDMRNMGGLRKELPAIFWLCIIVIMSRAGIPPFSSFFSKGLIVTGIAETGNLLILLLIYLSAGITFAYSIRFLGMTFFGEKSAYAAQKQIHPPPRLEIAAAIILAMGTLVLSALEPGLIMLLGVEGIELGIGQFFSLETLIFISILVVSAIPAVYYVRSKQAHPQRFPHGPLPRFNRVLTQGYYFDQFYDNVVASSILKVAAGTKSYVEDQGLQRIPNIIGTGVTQVSMILRQHLELQSDTLLQSVAAKLLQISQKTPLIIRKFIDRINSLLISKDVEGENTHELMNSDHILLAVLGFVFIIVLLFIIV